MHSGRIRLVAKKKYYHRKLIRDKIPDLIEKNRGSYKTKILAEAEYGKELKKKLLEESKELRGAPKESILNELADVLELVNGQIREIETLPKENKPPSVLFPFGFPPCLEPQR